MSFEKKPNVKRREKHNRSIRLTILFIKQFQLSGFVVYCIFSNLVTFPICMYLQWLVILKLVK